ncbi:hypothetical protein TGVEG_307000 [Toxoplasma gondii VEG]|uniref:Uncharacterized protein n=1 Tax=Toxoplasma gondii (strain ATCC 50861 / VEG) TaxID=432359 RepID=V5AWQ9_TOXGV|nr:hypothetical protein TGVEG_307000 [Toxoplasma gondii VEG]
MPQFVPVYDPERPRAEQDEADLQKHRRWENPHAILRTRRGDDDRNARPAKLKPVKSTMVRNSKGLWVPAAQAAAEAQREEARQRAALQKWGGAFQSENSEKAEKLENSEKAEKLENSEKAEKLENSEEAARCGRREEDERMERRRSRSRSGSLCRRREENRRREERGTGGSGNASEEEYARRRYRHRPSRDSRESPERRHHRDRRRHDSRHRSSSVSRSPSGERRRRDVRREREGRDREIERDFRDAMATVSAPSGEIDMFDYMSKKQRAMLKMQGAKNGIGQRGPGIARGVSGVHSHHGRADRLGGFHGSRTWR